MIGFNILGAARRVKGPLFHTASTLFRYKVNIENADYGIWAHSQPREAGPGTGLSLQFLTNRFAICSGISALSLALVNMRHLRRFS
jgi:hypothetical protein